MATVSSSLERTSSPGRLRPPAPLAASQGLIRVALFCGGHGSASLIGELLRHPDIHLSLLVNAYDDGLSTGELRQLLPDMLGPSDFRKNLARLVDPHSNEQYALRRFLDHRFATNFSSVDIRAFEEFVVAGKGWLPEQLNDLFAGLQPRLRSVIVGYLRQFFEFRKSSGSVFNYAGSSLGNLVFSGAYLASHDFNEAIQEITAICGARAELINVSCGENRTLVAVKEDGGVLWRESEIVGPQSPAPIRDFFLLAQMPDEEFRRELAGMSIEEKLQRLRAAHEDVQLSAEADYALRQAKLIIYGPGTQYSSLLPSYRTRGIAEAIAANRTALKLFIPNLDSDHDIRGLSASDLVDRALETFGASDGGEIVSHIFHNRESNSRPNGIKPGRITGAVYRGAVVISDRFENSAKPGIHSGHSVVSKALGLLEAGNEEKRPEAVEVYVDLLDRSRALDSLIEEFLELPWDGHFSRVTLRLNRVGVPKVNLPAYVKIEPAGYEGAFTEVDALLNWLAHGDTEYLVTLTGDGEYRLSDALLGIQFLRSSVFGVLHGSRTQSRRQFHRALDSAYGEHEWLRFISWCGAFVYTAAAGLRFRLIFSDPFTGFRIYRRRKLPDALVTALTQRVPSSGGAVMRMLIRHNIEIAEIPVTYRTFRGFTRAGWRIRRGLKNLLGVLW